MDKFFIRTAPDWIEVYKNGKLIADGHSLSATDLLDALGIEYDGIYIEDEDDWYNDVGVPNPE